ncbi:MAG TPA: cytochrome c oxidase subunit II [Candidatus Binatia bacterium]|nr:cytochrome c oxidase subunit II [Candidatus Binatia bacterium]
MSLKRVFALAAGAAGAMFWAGAALAQEVIGQPQPGEIGLQPPATSLAVELDRMHNYILTPIIFFIAAFVMVLLLIVIFRFNAKRNPVPSKVTHNTTIEILWTGIPVLILVLIAIPSFRLLYNQLDIPKPDLTIKAIGHQWYWSYVYPDNGDFTFDARMVTAEEAVAKEKNVIRLLDTDEEVVLPIHKNIRIQITSEDVIHSWTIPSFGIKHDAVPGRINESWFNIDKPGIYYGQCSELCGIQHAYMPIKVHAVTPEEFDAWVKQAQGKYDKAQEPAASNAAPASAASSQLASATQVQPAN